MSQGQHSQVDGDERYSTLLNNSNAVRAVTSAVEGTRLVEGARRDAGRSPRRSGHYQ